MRFRCFGSLADGPESLPVKILTFLVACVLVAGVLLLSGCTTPVYVDRKVEIPVTTPCHVHLPAVVPLPSSEATPKDLTAVERRRWILSAMYRDIVLLQGELYATRTAAKGCE